MDYRLLNAQSPTMQYSMLNIQDILSRFQGMLWFTLIDLAAGLLATQDCEMVSG